MDFAAPAKVTNRRFSDLEYLQHVGALETELSLVGDVNNSGLAFHTVAGERGQRILRLWRHTKEKGITHG